MIRTFWHVADTADHDSIAERGLFAYHPKTGHSGAEQIKNPGGAAIYLWDKFPSSKHRYHGAGELWAIELDEQLVKTDTMIRGACYLQADNVAPSALRYVGQMGPHGLLEMEGLTCAEIDRLTIAREFYSQGGATAWSRALHQIQPHLQLRVLHGWEMDYETLVPLSEVCVDADGSIITPAGPMPASHACTEVGASSFVDRDQTKILDAPRLWPHPGYYAARSDMDEPLMAMAKVTVGLTHDLCLPPPSLPAQVVQSGDNQIQL